MLEIEAQTNTSNRRAVCPRCLNGFRSGTEVCPDCENDNPPIELEEKTWQTIVQQRYLLGELDDWERHGRINSPLARVLGAPYRRRLASMAKWLQPRTAVDLPAPKPLPAQPNVVPSVDDHLRPELEEIGLAAMGESTQADVLAMPSLERPDVQPRSIWDRAVRPFLLQNWLYFLGSFLVLASGFYLLSLSWAGMGTDARLLTIWLGLGLGATSFAAGGRLVERKYKLDEAARIFWLIAVGLGTATAAAAGFALSVNLLIGLPLALAALIGTALLLTRLRPADGYNVDKLLLFQQLPMTLLVTLLPLALVFSTAGPLMLVAASLLLGHSLRRLPAFTVSARAIGWSTLLPHWTAVEQLESDDRWPWLGIAGPGIYTLIILASLWVFYSRTAPLSELLQTLGLLAAIWALLLTEARAMLATSHQAKAGPILDALALGVGLLGVLGSLDSPLLTSASCLALALVAFRTSQRQSSNRLFVVGAAALHGAWLGLVQPFVSATNGLIHLPGLLFLLMLARLCRANRQGALGIRNVLGVIFLGSFAALLAGNPTWLLPGSLLFSLFALLWARSLEDRQAGRLILLTLFVGILAASFRQATAINPLLALPLLGSLFGLLALGARSTNSRSATLLALFETPTLSVAALLLLIPLGILNPRFVASLVQVGPSQLAAGLALALLGLLWLAQARLTGHRGLSYGGLALLLLGVAFALSNGVQLAGLDVSHGRRLLFVALAAGALLEVARWLPQTAQPLPLYGLWGTPPHNSNATELWHDPARNCSLLLVVGALMFATLDQTIAVAWRAASAVLLLVSTARHVILQPKENLGYLVGAIGWIVALLLFPGQPLDGISGNPGGIEPLLGGLVCGGFVMSLLLVLIRQVLPAAAQTNRQLLLQLRRCTSIGVALALALLLVDPPLSGFRVLSALWLGSGLTLLLLAQLTRLKPLVQLGVLAQIPALHYLFVGADSALYWPLSVAALFVALALVARGEFWSRLSVDCAPSPNWVGGSIVRDRNGKSPGDALFSELPFLRISSGRELFGHGLGEAALVVALLLIGGALYYYESLQQLAACALSGSAALILLSNPRGRVESQARPRLFLGLLAVGVTVAIGLFHALRHKMLAGLPELLPAGTLLGVALFYHIVIGLAGRRKIGKDLRSFVVHEARRLFSWSVLAGSLLALSAQLNVHNSWLLLVGPGLVWQRWHLDRDLRPAYSTLMPISLLISVLGLGAIGLLAPSTWTAGWLFGCAALAALAAPLAIRASCVQSAAVLILSAAASLSISLSSSAVALFDNPGLALRTLPLAAALLSLCTIALYWEVKRLTRHDRTFWTRRLHSISRGVLSDSVRWALLGTLITSALLLGFDSVEQRVGSRLNGLLTLFTLGTHSVIWVGLARRDNREWMAWCGILAFSAIYAYLRMNWSQTLPFADHWNLLLIGAALLGLKVYWERTGDRILARVLQRLTPIVPLIAIGVGWFAAEQLPSGLLALSGVYYVSLANQSSRNWLYVPGLTLINIELYLLWYERGLTHPEFYALPFGLTLLLFSAIYREQIGQYSRAALRTVALLTIYFAGLVQMIMFNSVGEMLLLAGLSIAGVLAGITLQIRSYLYLGAVFLISDVVFNLFRIGLNDRLIGLIFLFVTGLAMLLAAVYFNLRRDRVQLKLQSLSDNLSGWEI